MSQPWNAPIVGAALQEIAGSVLVPTLPLGHHVCNMCGAPISSSYSFCYQCLQAQHSGGTSNVGILNYALDDSQISIPISSNTRTISLAETEHKRY